MRTMVLFFMVVFCATSAFSQLVTFEFSASVSSFSADETGVVPDISVGESFTGWFSYDNSVDGVPYDTTTQYTQTSSSEISIGDILISHMNQSVEIGVTNDYYNSREDRVEDQLSYRFWTLVPELGQDEIFCSVSFFDYTALAFDSFELPTSLDMTEFDNATIFLYRSTPSFSIHGQIDSITLVPEPATLAMLALGGLLIRRRRAA